MTPPCDVILRRFEAPQGLNIGEGASLSPAEADTLLDWCEEAAMYDICITKIGVVPMTRRSDIIKILVIAALLGVLFYYLAHYGLSVPQSI